ncbi:MAG: zinc-ribbon domain-containing protein [Thermoplasmata archaeon]|jgi:rubrerythrin|nr:zinc-ribbon domain-containing protein [Thermoplasmata archaeon]
MGQEPLHVFVFGCIACGKTVAGNETSCPRCGASFEDVLFECPFCGELVSPRETKCTSCGTEFSAFSEGVMETCNLDLDGSESDALPEVQKPKEPEPERAEATEYECPNCGKPVAESDTTCPHCGVNFG